MEALFFGSFLLGQQKKGTRRPGETGGLPPRQRTGGLPVGKEPAGCRPGNELQPIATAILPIRACHSFGPVSCTLVPFESTATVTGMSAISNS